MAVSHKHIVPLSAWRTLVDAARWLIALAVLVLTAADAGIWGGSYTAFGLTLFTVSQAAFQNARHADCFNQAIATLIIIAYIFVAGARKSAFYNVWAVLALEIFDVIFWIVSFPLYAEWTAVANNDWLVGWQHLYEIWVLGVNTDHHGGRQYRHQ
jgi:hypothetical protein